jgi:hypothetical protein
MLEESNELDGTKYRRMRPDHLPNAYLGALERSVQDLLARGWTVVEMGHRRKVDNLGLSSLNRRRAEVKRRGLNR